MRERNARLHAAILRIGASLDLDTVLREVVDSARALTGARYGMIATVDDAGEIEEFIASGLSDDERRQMAEWPHGYAFFQHLRDLPGALRLADLTANDMMTLRALLEKSSDADVLREMIGFTAERLMALEVEGLTGAAHGERTPERITHRNGYRERSWETRAGTVALKIPKLRKGSYFPGLPYAAADGGEGADGGDPGGLHPGRVDPLGRRPGAGDGHVRHLQEPGLQAVRGDRRQDPELPRPAAGG